MKPKVFIASSTKGIPVAEAIQRELHHESEPIVWTQGIFRTTNVPIEDLMSSLEQFDFAIFVFLPEDTTTMRDKTEITVRDNVIFELGLFLGKLGRERNFFIAPKSEKSINLHLPSDLSGISPATYAPDTDNLQASVGAALYEIKQSIRKLGSSNKHEIVIYDCKKNFKPYHIKNKNGYIWKNGKKDSPISDGVLQMSDDGVLKLERKNIEGRYEIELRQTGPDVPSLPKKHEPVYRVIKVSCDVKADNGSHQLRFVMKDIRKDEWAAKEIYQVDNTDWRTLTMYFRINPSIDILFRIDHEKPSEAPSTIYIRNIVIIEEN